VVQITVHMPVQRAVAEITVQMPVQRAVVQITVRMSRYEMAILAGSPSAT